MGNLSRYLPTNKQKVARWTLLVALYCRPLVSSIFSIYWYLIFKLIHLNTVRCQLKYPTNEYTDVPRWTWTAWWRHQMATFSASLAICAGIHRSPVNSPHKGQWRGALIFFLIYVWINGWVNNREAGDLRRHRGHYDVYICESRSVHLHIDGLVQEKRNANVLAMELRLSCIKPSICRSAFNYSNKCDTKTYHISNHHLSFTNQIFWIFMWSQ